MNVVKSFSDVEIKDALLMALANMCLENDCTIAYKDISFCDVEENVKVKVLRKEEDYNGYMG